MDCYLGEIRMFAGNYAPENWALCNGALLPISTNEALFSLLSTTYGGDGQTTFGLPDLRGRTPIGQGQGVGLTNRVLGQKDGVEEVILLGTDMPAHGHTYSASTTAATTPTAGPAVMSGAMAGLQTQYLMPSAAISSSPAFDNASIQSTGGNQPHENMMPSLGVTFIISLIGTYPMRS